MNTPAAPKIVYIAGSPRSGTTVLARILGVLPGCTTVGELKLIWDRGFRQDFACGCGLPFKDCPFWRDVVSLWRARTDIDVDRGITLRDQLRTRSAGRLIRDAKRGRPRHGVAEYIDRMQHLYEAIAEKTGARVIVDSSKAPADALALASFSTLDIEVIHLVRDPRGIAQSWSRPKPDPSRPGGSTRAVGVLIPTLMWVHWNRAIRTHVNGAIGTTLVRYEDLCRDPDGVLRDVTTRVGLPNGSIKISPDGSVDLPCAHTVVGNPMRFESGSVKISLDDAWQRALPASKRLVVQALTWPLLRTFGY